MRAFTFRFIIGRVWAYGVIITAVSALVVSLEIFYISNDREILMWTYGLFLLPACATLGLLMIDCVLELLEMLDKDHHDEIDWSGK